MNKIRISIDNFKVENRMSDEERKKKYSLEFEPWAIISSYIIKSNKTHQLNHHRTIITQNIERDLKIAQKYRAQ